MEQIISRERCSCPGSAEQAKLLLVLTLGFEGELLDAIERHLLGQDERLLCLERAHEAFLHKMEFAHGLAGKNGSRIEARLALERGLELAQGSVLADAADEPARDLIAALVVEVARRLRGEHEAEA